MTPVPPRLYLDEDVMNHRDSVWISALRSAT